MQIRVLPTKNPILHWAGWGADVAGNGESKGIQGDAKLIQGSSGWDGSLPELFHAAGGFVAAAGSKLGSGPAEPGEDGGEAWGVVHDFARVVQDDGDAVGAGGMVAGDFHGADGLVRGEAQKSGRGFVWQIAGQDGFSLFLQQWQALMVMVAVAFIEVCWKVRCGMLGA